MRLFWITIGFIAGGACVVFAVDVLSTPGGHGEAAAATAVAEVFGKLIAGLVLLVGAVLLAVSFGFLVRGPKKATPPAAELPEARVERGDVRNDGAR